MTPTINSSACAVEFRHVIKVYENGGTRITVLDDITGSIPQGAVVTLVGPSGAGKSTLLSLCNLMTSPDAGEVIVHQKEVRQWPIPDLRRRVGLVFQSPVMFPGSVLDNLRYGPMLRGETLDDPDYFMQSVGLSADLLQRDASDLSGGQRQRVALARTLVNKPDILLLDEVTSALDPSAAQDVEDWILRIHAERHTTLLWVTHNLEQARRIGEYAWLLMDGRLVEATDTDRFFGQPVNDRTREFLHTTSWEQAPL